MSDYIGGIDSGSEDELYHANTEWKKLNDKSAKEGYREGLNQATEDSLQKGFDQGYAQSFQCAILFGEARGRLVTKRIILGEESEQISTIDKLFNELDDYQTKFKSDLDSSEIKLFLEEIHRRIDLIGDQ